MKTTFLEGENGKIKGFTIKYQDNPYDHFLPEIQKGYITWKYSVKIVEKNITKSNREKVKPLLEILKATALRMRCLLSDHGPRISKREIVSCTMNEEDNEVMAADLLIRNKIHYLPVVRNGYLVGIVTMRDLLKAMIEEEENIGQEEKS